MDFLNLFKKNKKENEKNVFSGKGLLDYIQSSIKNPTDENVLKALESIAKPDDDLEHLTAEGELPWGWHTHNSEFIGEVGGEYSYFLNLWLDARSKPPKELHSVLKSFILFLEDAEKLCKSKGECFEYWYYEILTSRDYIEKRRTEFSELSQNLEEKQQEYERRMLELVDLDRKIIEKLKENANILQSDFVKMFDPAIKKDVQEKLYYMDKEGKLQRTKSGGSYILHYKK